MGGMGRYHITMLVTDEEELAIRSLYQEKRWNCLLHVLSEEIVSSIYQSGFSSIFPIFAEAQDNFDKDPAEFKVIKTEVIPEHSEENIVEEIADVAVDNIVNSEKTTLIKDEKSDSEDRTDTASETDTAEETCTANESDTSNGEKNLLKYGTLVKRGREKRQKKMERLKCEACGNFYFGKRSLRRHYYHVHRDLMPKPSCPVCNQQFRTYTEMLKHKREKQHNTCLWMLKTYQCDTCGKILTRYSALLNHKKYVCGKGEKEDQELRVHSCDMCEKKFKTGRDVKCHKRDVHFKVQTVCDVCGKVCLDKRAMLSHRKRHDEANKIHSCNYCGKTFFGTCNLKQHVRIHTKEKPYKCPLCTYRSGVMGNITKHTVNVHKQRMTAVDLRKTKVTTELS